MIEIKKGTEPKELLEYRKKEFASYADMKGDVKEKVMKSLLSEQGHLCAYCMSCLLYTSPFPRLTAIWLRSATARSLFTLAFQLRVGCCTI